MTSWREPLPLPSWKDFLRGAWNAMFNIEKVAEAIERIETSKVVERIEGHLIVLSEHAESATLARRRRNAVDFDRDFRVAQLRTIGTSAVRAVVRVVEERTGFEETLDAIVLPDGSCTPSTAQRVDPTGDQCAEVFVALLDAPPSVHIAQVCVGRFVAFRGECRNVRLSPVTIGEPSFISVSIVHRSTQEVTP